MGKQVGDDILEGSRRLSMYQERLERAFIYEEC